MEEESAIEDDVEVTLDKAEEDMAVRDQIKYKHLPYFSGFLGFSL